MTDISSDDLLIYTTEIVTALLSNSEVDSADLPELISSVSAVIGSLGRAAEPAREERRPAVPIAQSIRPDHLVCLEDGKKMKLLKRYLRANFGMSPEEYRARWNLPADYPMIAPGYAATRKTLALKSGLGRVAKAAPAQEAIVEKPQAPAAPPAQTPPAATEPARRAKLKPVFRAAPPADPVVPTERPATSDKAAPVVVVTTRRPLSSRIAAAPGADEAEGREHQAVICQAVAGKTCVRAIYNKKDVILAPYVVYTRNDELFMRAVTIEHDGRRPREPKLGTFKLLGLNDVTSTTRRFIPQFDFDPEDAQYAGKTICSI